MAETFRVNELFTSLQGEGRFTGKPSIFVRFQGCPVRCPFCDSPTTWDRGQRASASTLRLDDLISEIQCERQRFPHIGHVVLTGGEPFYRNPALVSLCMRLLEDNRVTIQFETSGVVPHPAFFAFLDQTPEVARRIWITLSPKLPVGRDPSRFLPVAPEFIRHFSELKFLVSTTADADGPIRSFLDDVSAVRDLRSVRISVQPMDTGDAEENERTRQAATVVALENGWFLSLQTHKMLGIR